MSDQSPTMRMGMIGLGVGGAEILRAMDAMPCVEIVAGADVVPATLQRFKERYPRARTYESAEGLMKDSDVDAVWVSSPNRFHAQHAILAANHGKHVVVEKPMAISLDQAAAMVEAAERNSVNLLAGHTRAFTRPIRAMRKLIASGDYGELRAVNIWSYSDWMLRPRTPDELDVDQGGGVPYRQGPQTIPGYYAAFLEFENGVPATVVHNGYGYFIANELVPWGSDRAIYGVEQRIAIRRAMRSGKRDEIADKQAIRIGGERENEYFSSGEDRPWVPEDMGMAIASLDRADIRQSKFGIFIHDDDGKRDIDVMSGQQRGVAQRRAELEELYAAIYCGKPLWHDGRWGMATLEACLAMIESSRSRREVTLRHQVPVPKGYDYDVDFFSGSSVRASESRAAQR